MKRFILRLAVAILTFVAGIWAFLLWETVRAPWKDGPHSNEFNLVLTTETPALRVGEYPVVRVFITNNSDKTVTLVHPGDGSEVGWRTPIVDWSIVETGPHFVEPYSHRKFRMCGNINALDWDEIFRLAPGETKQLKAHLTSFRTPGSYNVNLVYANRPNLKWGGWELGMHHPITMWRVRHSTDVTLASNQVSFTVTE